MGNIKMSAEREIRILEHTIAQIAVKAREATAWLAFGTLFSAGARAAHGQM
jgi:hypothetical protein